MALQKHTVLHWGSLFGTEKVSRGDLDTHVKQRRGEREFCPCLGPMKKAPGPSAG